MKVFVSSVQNELEDERLIVQNLLNTDPFLSANCSPVLFEFEPASPEKALDGCLKSLDGCDVYLLIVAAQYGTVVSDISITHAEYRRAKTKKLPVLVFIRGDRKVQREKGTETFLKELEDDGWKYKRFGNVIELQKEVRAAFVKLLKDQFGIAPSSDENEVAQQTIEATSTFESQPLTRLRWSDLDHEVVRELLAAAEGTGMEKAASAELLTKATQRGLVWFDPGAGEHYATAAGIVLLARDPSAIFPQCRILADAYRNTEPDGKPDDYENICGPMPTAINRATAFIERNTRHPMRIVGLNRVRLDEYPDEALREALVNAVAHRRYEDAGRKIILEVFADRVVISSPGLPPAPITLPSLRSGKYRPCSRNPVLAQCLSYFHRIEERGSGFRRMRDQMLDHGLDRPSLSTNTGYFQVTFCGPGENLDRIRVPATLLMVTPSIEAKLNERQRTMLHHLVQGRELTSRDCQAEFQVTRPVSASDFGKLVALGLAEKVGGGRSTRYRLKPSGDS
jgi:ATP-dependent DNA helicase RecG